MVFSLVIVRVGLGLSSETTAAGAKSRLTFFSPDNNDTMIMTHTDRPGIQPHPKKHMVVRIMQDQTQDHSERSEYDEGYIDIDGSYSTCALPAPHDGPDAVCRAEPSKEHGSGPNQV